MKKLLSIALVLALILGLVPAALAEVVTPTPPEWINAEDYLVFPGDEVYLPENWAKVEALREEARNGALLPDDDSKNWAEGSAGMCYETALVRIKYALNAEEGTQERRMGFYSAGRAFSAAKSGWEGKAADDLCHRLNVEKSRAWVIYSGTYISNYMGLTSSLQALDMTVDDFFTGQYMYLCSEDHKAAALAGLAAVDATPGPAEIKLYLDGSRLGLDVPPEIKNQRTMVPVRAVGEAIGADVEWVQDKQQVVMTRAGSTVTMTLDSTTADIDGKAVEMDVAPYATNGRTLLPARYVAEFFGQKVDWDDNDRRVLITEDKSVAGDSNLEAWALPMGAMLNDINNAAPQHFGDGTARSKVRADHAHSILDGDQWTIADRNELARTVVSMTLSGHNASFRDMAADVKLRTPEERAKISAASEVWPDYMWEYTEYVDQKWGDRGILAWDLFRMSNLVQWGYTAGYVTYAEALELLEPAATILCENFSSWDEAYENYLDGYNWWARNDVVGQDIWQTERGKRYQAMKQDPKIAPIFDDTLFQTGVIGLPD